MRFTLTIGTVYLVFYVRVCCRTQFQTVRCLKCIFCSQPPCHIKKSILKKIKMSLRFCSYLLDQKCQMLIRTIIEFFLAVDESCIPLSILQEIMFVAVRVVNTCCSQSSIRSFIEAAINAVDLFLYQCESNLLYTKQGNKQQC